MAEKTAKGYRFRLMLGLPVMVMCFTLAAGFLPLGFLTVTMRDVSHTSDLLAVLPNLRISVLLITLAATSLAFAIATYIVRPIEQITQEITELAAQQQLNISSVNSSDEIQALSQIYTQAVTPLKGILNSTDLLMQMSEGIIGLNRSGQVLFINSHMESLLGIDRRAYVGRPYSDVFPNGSANFEMQEMIRSALQTYEQSSRDVIVTTPAGRSVYIRVTASPASTGQNQPLGLILLFKSFDEFDRVKGDLRKLDVLASLGTSVAGMAHEIRTPLGYIRGLVELIVEDLPADARQREYAEKVLDSVERLNAIVGNILSLARPPSETSSAQDPVTLVREAIAYTRSALHPNKLLLLEDYAENIALIRGDRDRLLEAFINLFKNACEASLSGGTVTVRVRPVRIGGPPNSGGSAVMVEFHNNGVPIPAGQIDKLFLPFFTTKKEGTGLGLAITKQIVDNHGGAIRVESEQVTGTLFRVLLPAAGEPAAPAAV
jgi:two-component system sensor histidine kinase PilS (NtrC family)